MSAMPEGHELEPGDKVLIRTVTVYTIGRVLAANEGWIVVGDAAWVADTGRWSKALATGELSEVEMSKGPVRVSTGAIVDVHEWHHDLPTETR